MARVRPQERHRRRPCACQRSGSDVPRGAHSRARAHTACKIMTASELPLDGRSMMALPFDLTTSIASAAKALMSDGEMPAHTGRPARNSVESLASAAPGASGPSESQLPDRVEQKSAGLQLEYSASTAEWLRRVAEAPHDFALVYNFVSNLLSDSDQPLGALTRRFATLFDSLFLPAHQSSLRKSFSAEALTEKLAGPAASRSRVGSRSRIRGWCTTTRLLAARR